VLLFSFWKIGIEVWECIGGNSPKGGVPMMCSLALELESTSEVVSND
jgi:hypothetical protein